MPKRADQPSTTTELDETDQLQLLPMVMPAAATHVKQEPQQKPSSIAQRERRTRKSTDGAAPLANAIIVAPPPAEPPLTAMATLAAVFEVWPAEEPGLWLIDPRAVTVDPINARFGAPFVAEKRTDLIASMVAQGNTVPVKLRRMGNGSPGFLCLSGSQRLGAALDIQKREPGFRLRAVIYDDLSDADAFRLGEADNAGRTDVTPMEQARHWGAKLDTVYGGDRKALIAATGKSASVVSRTLALLALPEYVLACCSDREALTPYFAEQIVPRLGDPAEEPAIRRRAEALVTASRTLPGAKLVKALLADAPAPGSPAQPIWSAGDGAAVVTFRPSPKGGRIEIAGTLHASDRREIRKALGDLVDGLCRSP